MIERAAAYLLSPPLYAVGHLASKLMHLHCMFGVYQWAMRASCDVEDWAGVEIMWRTVET